MNFFFLCIACSLSSSLWQINFSFFSLGSFAIGKTKFSMHFSLHRTQQRRKILFRHLLSIFQRILFCIFIIHFSAGCCVCLREKLKRLFTFFMTFLLFGFYIFFCLFSLPLSSLLCSRNLIFLEILELFCSLCAIVGESLDRLLFLTVALCLTNFCFLLPSLSPKTQKIKFKIISR